MTTTLQALRRLETLARTALAESQSKDEATYWRGYLGAISVATLNLEITEVKWLSGMVQS